MFVERLETRIKQLRLALRVWSTLQNEQIEMSNNANLGYSLDGYIVEIKVLDRENIFVHFVFQFEMKKMMLIK